MLINLGCTFTYQTTSVFQDHFLHSSAAITLGIFYSAPTLTKRKNNHDAHLVWTWYRSWHIIGRFSRLYPRATKNANT